MGACAAAAATSQPLAWEARLSVIAISSLTGLRLPLSPVPAERRDVAASPRELGVADPRVPVCLERSPWVARRRRRIGSKELGEVEGVGDLRGCLLSCSVM